MRSTVEGGQRKSHDAFGYRPCVPENLTGGIPQDSIPTRLKVIVPSRVASRPVASIMSLAINLDYELCRRAIEIHDVGIDRMLFAESRAHRRPLETLPQQDLG